MFITKKSPPVTGGLHRGINGSDYNILMNKFIDRSNLFP